jgi:hypothetical protein
MFISPLSRKEVKKILPARLCSTNNRSTHVYDNAIPKLNWPALLAIKVNENTPFYGKGYKECMHLVFSTSCLVKVFPFLK